MWLLEFVKLDTTVFYVFCAISGVIVLLSSCVVFASCFIPGRSGASSTDVPMVCGTVIIAYTVLVRGVDIDWKGVSNRLDTICEFYPAALLLGLTLYVGGLFVKGWGIYLYQYFNRDQPVEKEEWKPSLWLWLLVVIAAVVDLVWCIKFTPELKCNDDSKVLECRNATQVLECRYKDGLLWMTITSAWHGALLVLAVAAVIPNCKHAPHVEASLHSVSTLNTLLATVTGICVYFLYGEEHRTEHYAINGGLLLWVCLIADILILTARLCSQRGKCNSGPMDNYDTIKERNSREYPHPGHKEDTFAF